MAQDLGAGAWTLGAGGVYEPGLVPPFRAGSRDRLAFGGGGRWMPDTRVQLSAGFDGLWDRSAGGSELGAGDVRLGASAYVVDLGPIRPWLGFAVKLPDAKDEGELGTDETDITFGFDSAMSIATEAIDRLHTTATSHHRIIVCEIMGHDAGWLCLGAGIAGGADVILIPEIPYDLDAVVRTLTQRRRSGKRFSIIAVAEGIVSKAEAGRRAQQGKKTKKNADPDAAPAVIAPHAPDAVHLVHESVASRLARHIQQLTGVEARVTSLGHVQRGGPPTAFDRLLCTRLGTKAGELLAQGHYNIMVGVKGTECVPVPLENVAGFKRTVPPDHAWIKTARLVETCLGDEAV